jgi:hypothetical protein
MNNDGHFNAADIKAMEQALTGNSVLTSDYLVAHGDFNKDGQLTNADLTGLIAALKAGQGSTSVPEPSSMVLAGIAGVALWLSKRRHTNREPKN